MRSLLPLVTVCAVASALTIRSTSVPTIPFAVNLHVNPSELANSGKTFAQVERERAQQLIATGKARALSKANTAQERSIAHSVSVDNSQVSYTAQVNIGSPATAYTLLIDTGSSNTWVGADKPYKKTSASTQTSNSVSVTYGSGNFSGTEFTDRVSLSPELVIDNQSIGGASTSQGFDGVDGILGVGPTDLTIGTLSPDSLSAIPTVVDNLYSQGTISSAKLSVFFAPTTSAENVTTGELTFGATDPAKHTGPVNYVPITLVSPASTFWGIDQKITYGESLVLSSTAGIVDTGTTLVLLATDAFKTYQSSTGGVFDKATGLLKISQAQFKNLKPLRFHVGGQVYTLTPNAQIWPRFLNTVIGGSNDAIYLIVNDLGTNSGEGLDFVSGFAFLQRFYSVYDTENHRVGLAETSFTDAPTN